MNTNATNVAITEEMKKDIRAIGIKNAIAEVGYHPPRVVDAMGFTMDTIDSSLLIEVLDLCLIALRKEINCD